MEFVSLSVPATNISITRDSRGRLKARKMLPIPRGILAAVRVPGAGETLLLPPIFLIGQRYLRTVPGAITTYPGS